jgi:hypothetical protein
MINSKLLISSILRRFFVSWFRYSSRVDLYSCSGMSPDMNRLSRARRFWGALVT